jgi:5-methylcytosine-specific restriction endonuclease McrA
MKDYSVLVLNADFIPLHLVPISTISWQDAFKMLTEGTVTPVKFYEDAYVHTPSTKYRVPSVIVLKTYKHIKKHAKWSKGNVKLRDEFKCQYCGKRFSEKSLTIDHVIPKKNGGKHSWGNSVAACKPCNARKSHHLNMKPLRKPYHPSYYELTKKWLDLKGYENKEWKEFIG